jgi:FkbM family methyltransferase
VGLARKLLKLPGLSCRYLAGDRMVRHQVHYRIFPVYYAWLFWILPHLAGQGNNRLFVDLGANIGGGFSYFSTVFSPRQYTYHFFEPNPHCVAQLKKRLAKTYFAKPYKIYPNAAWVKNETLKFFGIAESDNKTTEGGSILADHNSLFYKSNPRKALKVKAVDMAQYLARMETQYDSLVIKMDIEGAELEVLEHLWKKPNLFTKPTVMFVEFHSIYLTGKARQKAKQRELAIMRNAPANVRLYEWF